MVGPFDASFLTGIVLVALALGVAYGAMANPDLPIVGSGRGALLTVAVLGMAGCSVGGLSQAPVLGWSHPYIIVGSVLGVVALVVITSGLLEWDLVLRPVAQLVPGRLAVRRVRRPARDRRPRRGDRREGPDRRRVLHPRDTVEAIARRRASRERTWGWPTGRIPTPAQRTNVPMRPRSSCGRSRGESRFIPTPFGDTHVIVSGEPDGDAVVMLHAASLTAAQWYLQAGDLGRTHRLYAVDIMGDIGLSRQRAEDPHASTGGGLAGGDARRIGAGPRCAGRIVVRRLPRDQPRGRAARPRAAAWPSLPRRRRSSRSSRSPTCSFGPAACCHSR